MLEYGLPALYALFVWWFSTGLIFYLDGLPRQTFRWSMLGATVVLLGSLYGLAVSSADTSVTGAYLAFTCGLLAWGWQQMSFYMGYVTGPRKEACPENCGGWRHFIHAAETSLYHELAIIVGAAALIGLTWGEPNQIGVWTFIVLWWMHLSAKLNVFFGVRNLNEELLPEHLQYLRGFLTKKPMNLLFPLSITVSTVATAILIQMATAGGVSAFAAAGYTFLAAMMALAVLEHWFLVLPLPAAALWSWFLRSHRPSQPVEAEGAQGELRPREDAMGLDSWSARLSGPCDPQSLRDLLEALAQGAFGEIDRVKGIARAGSGWVHFNVAGGRSSMAAFAPGEQEEARVVAIGRALDEARLQAAFDACSAQRAAA